METDLNRTTRRGEASTRGPRKYLRKAQVAERYGITVRSVDRMTEDGRLPLPVRLGRTPLWDEALLDEHDRTLAREAIAPYGRT